MLSKFGITGKISGGTLWKLAKNLNGHHKWTERDKNNEEFGFCTNRSVYLSNKCRILWKLPLESLETNFVSYEMNLREKNTGFDFST